MTGEKKEYFDANTLKIALEKEIEARFAKYWSDQVLATHQTGETLNITQYINAQEIENILVFDSQFGLFSDGFRKGLGEVGFAERRFLVGLILDLMYQYVYSPAKFSGHTDVELALEIIFTFFQNNSVMGPSYFCH